jgi:hypothetical protein
MNYKRKLLTLLLLVTTLVSCTVDSADAISESQQISNVSTIIGTWNLVRSTTFEGVNLEYPSVVVKYTFEENNVLIVENNAIETLDTSPKPSGKLITGTYSYSLTENNGIVYLLVTNSQGNQSEIGSVTLNLDNSLSLNQTESSVGTEFYDYILNFEQ